MWPRNASCCRTIVRGYLYVLQIWSRPDTRSVCMKWCSPLPAPRELQAQGVTHLENKLLSAHHFCQHLITKWTLWEAVQPLPIAHTCHAAVSITSLQDSLTQITGLVAARAQPVPAPAPTTAEAQKAMEFEAEARGVKWHLESSDQGDLMSHNVSFRAFGRITKYPGAAVQVLAFHVRRDDNLDQLTLEVYFLFFTCISCIQPPQPMTPCAACGQDNFLAPAYWAAKESGLPLLPKPLCHVLETLQYMSPRHREIFP